MFFLKTNKNDMNLRMSIRDLKKCKCSNRTPCNIASVRYDTKKDDSFVQGKIDGDISSTTVLLS